MERRQGRQRRVVVEQVGLGEAGEAVEGEVMEVLEGGSGGGGGQSSNPEEWIWRHQDQTSGSDLPLLLLPSSPSSQMHLD
ncbi:hypothetical protein CYMTET_12666 [Cymbomonas tetramitiformis]|uniref:Uncharacterized protein n=1 Tax=Cymbomonas tetramitiformis TaxID=36881 RepID=A0AAE0LBL8_9CHLO|nr:hypothetical protein CYMTET_12666 [Cymbomonas tetramitiformis]